MTDYFQILKDLSQRQIPPVLDPMRAAGNRFADTLLQKRPAPISNEQFNSMSLPEKIIREGKYAGAVGGAGMSAWLPTALAGALSTSPPGQLVQYIAGQPDPGQQLLHASQGLSLTSPLLLGGRTPSAGDQTNPYSGNTSSPGTKWINGPGQPY